MAEETKTIETTTETNNEQTPTVEELMSQLAAAKADADRYKNLDDTEYFPGTAEEQEAEAKAEAQRIADEERESMRKELNHIKAVNAYKAIGDEKTVDKLIDAVSDADHNAIATIIANECKKAVAEAEAKWLKDRPRVKTGQYSSMTREQIMSIQDREERTKAIAMNQGLFN